ncbi:kinase [Lithospermum erythrorhizon]|uniref:Kinase n=1 Tax=Lithospermum erythrorhizon TaxID=34254 RepID=A0AAV3PRN4_LITER
MIVKCFFLSEVLEHFELYCVWTDVGVSLATIARKRPVLYSNVLSALFEFNSIFDVSKGGHTVSIQYSVRTALLGFLKCTHPMIMESREKLLKVLRAMNAGEAAEHVIRQVEKMMRNYQRASRDSQPNKDEQVLDCTASMNLIKKRPLPSDSEDLSTNNDIASKRTRYLVNHVAPSFDDSGLNHVNGVSPEISLLDNELTPIEQMVAMIGRFVAAGEEGVKSLEVVMSTVQPDMLADIVITNMKHLPMHPLPLNTIGNLSLNQSNDSSGAAHSVRSVSSPIPVQMPVTSSQISSSSDMSTSVDPTSDSKRDPRRDPRRLDPRRSAAPVGVNNDNFGSAFEFPPNSMTELNTSTVQPVPLGPDENAPPIHSVPSTPTPEIKMDMQVPKIEFETKTSYSTEAHGSAITVPEEEIKKEENEKSVLHMEVKESLEGVVSSASQVEEGRVEEVSDIIVVEELYSPSVEETELSPEISNIEASEDACVDFPMLPTYVELTEQNQRNIEKMAVERIIDPEKNLRGTACKDTRTVLLARLAIQIVDDADLVELIQTHIISDYKQKGHELVLGVLYHLHTLMESDLVENSSSSACVYEKFLVGVVKLLLDALPATDKSLSRLLSEVPWLPDSVMRLLEDLCSQIHSVKDGHDGDRVTQGLGAVWSLILARPHNREGLLDIALKCAAHPKDDIRTKAIRLVANKLYVLSYISGRIEEFARSKFLLAIDPPGLDKERSQCGTIEQRTEREIGSQETSISGSQVSELAVSEDDCVKTAQLDFQSDSSMTFGQAQSLISLYFALCTKRPSLLQLVFESFGFAPKPVKQAVIRHIPILIRAVGSSYSDLLRIISDPPSGSESLLTQVLYILSEDATLSDLIPTVKHLYETKLKDATILIPVLSSFSKSEVLPIFPRLVDLPLDKFQTALDRILQGTAHSGPALTPAEVLVAIHDIKPEKDGLPLKKITEVCSACFEQRTVFTQQVLAKALNQMVDQTPLPLLFMRTVIQAIDAFPTLVDFVMEILSKLISRQVWRMPKLWVGFLKCISQTQPHSFPVLLQLPPPQLESSLNKYPNLRSSLASFASQPSVKNDLSRSTLEVLGLLMVRQYHDCYGPLSADESTWWHILRCYTDGCTSSVRLVFSEHKLSAVHDMEPFRKLMLQEAMLIQLFADVS